MLNFDLTVTVSVILALCALLSPVLTALINNHHQQAMRKLDFELDSKNCEHLRKKQIIENYLSSAASYLNRQTIENSSKYYSCYSVALLYVSDEVLLAMRNVNSHIADDEIEIAQDFFFKANKLLRDPKNIL